LNIFKSICIYLIERDECFKGYLEQFQSKKNRQSETDDCTHSKIRAFFA